MIKSLSLSSLQSLLILVDQAITTRETIESFRSALASEVDIRIGAITDGAAPVIRASRRRRPDNVVTCAVCGSSAVIVPLPPADRSATATHAIQCQNRPATDQPWRDGMCGHTEYIVRGDR